MYISFQLWYSIEYSHRVWNNHGSFQHDNGVNAVNLPRYSTYDNYPLQSWEITSGQFVCLWIASEQHRFKRQVLFHVTIQHSTDTSQAVAYVGSTSYCFSWERMPATCVISDRKRPTSILPNENCSFVIDDKRALVCICIMNNGLVPSWRTAIVYNSDGPIIPCICVSAGQQRLSLYSKLF